MLRLSPLLLLVSGCGLLSDLDGLTNPMVMESMFVGVEAPQSDLIDLTGTEFEGGAGATVLLADAQYADQLEEAPIEGADVSMQLDGGAWLPMRDDGDGKYVVDDGLVYLPGQALGVRVKDDGIHAATLRTPDALDVELPESVATHAPLVVRTESPGVNTLAVVVMDPETKELVFDNRPVSIEDVYALTHDQGTLAVEIPGVVFSRPGMYVVGVAGLAISQQENLDNVNTTISALMAGTIRFYVVDAEVADGGEQP
jgi:hypothetical protein